MKKVILKSALVLGVIFSVASCKKDHKKKLMLTTKKKENTNLSMKRQKK